MGGGGGWLSRLRDGISSNALRKRAQTLFTCAIKDSLRCSPQLCNHIPETRLSVHARLASDTQYDTAFIKLVGFLAFSVSRRNFCFPAPDPSVPTKCDWVQNSVWRQVRMNIQGPIHTDYLWLCMKLGNTKGPKFQ